MPSQTVDDSEYVFRRVPEVMVPFGEISPEAFRPTNDDTTGLSIDRASVSSAHDVAMKGRAGKTYYVAKLAVRKLRAIGLDAVSDDPVGGHAVIPQLRTDNRSTGYAKSAYLQITNVCIEELVGPWTVPVTSRFSESSPPKQA